ncbi:hypothetical protein CKO12_11030 [Chromatium okenii]|uniref:BrnT family toxin n=1 Tax=Chromatium okenii TaxID=61644 RepID=UPI0019044826|nr:BrnT family toxin [Chromatium okenii]MBK1642400.1 hypothetical protein [Chromatium okenii]
MNFEWDDKKAAKNLKKHGLSFQEAASVFGDPLAITFDDSSHSVSEYRLLTFGRTINGKMVVVSHTERSQSMRIISARLMAQHEKSIYEEG